MAHETALQNNLRATRLRLGLSQQDLAEAAGVTRQTVSGIEAGQFSPSATVALRLARALGCRMEDLFWLAEDLPEIEARLAAGTSGLGRPAWQGQPSRVVMARIGADWVAHPLEAEEAFRTVLTPADGVVAGHAPGGRVRVRMLEEPAGLRSTVMLAGCTPSLSLWAHQAEHWHNGLRVLWTFANSMGALHSLARGEVHAAGVHLYDPESGEHNVPFARRVLKGRAALLVNLGTWEEGLLVRPGNPMGIRTAADLARSGVRLVNREEGAGSRFLLDRTLREAGISPDRVAGYSDVVNGHLEVARCIREGKADAGVSAAPVAAVYGLGFIPWHQVRYDLVLLKEYMNEPAVRLLLNTLSHGRVRSQLEAVGGFDTSRTGEVVAELPGRGDAR